MGDNKSELLTKLIAEGERYEESQRYGEAIKAYEWVINEKLKVPDEVTDEAVKAKEIATYKLANIYKEKSLVDELIALQKSLLPLFIDLPKSKVAKIIRTLFDITTALP